MAGWLGWVVRWVDLALRRRGVDGGARIGAATELGYGGLGIAIGPGVEIGEECFIAHGVSLQATAAGAPRIGNRVYIGAGAAVVGPVVIEDYAVIGANAVVDTPVARGAIMGGVPARELRRDPEPERSFQQWLSAEARKRDPAE